MVIKKIKALSICGEGGGMELIKYNYPDGTTKFVDELSKLNGTFDCLDFESEIRKGLEDKIYDSFEEFWQMHSNCGGWWYLGYYDMLPEIKVFIKQELIEASIRLNWDKEFLESLIERLDK